MFSEIKKLINVLIFFSVISVVFSIFSLFLLYDNRISFEFKGMIFILFYLIVFVPIVFIIISVALKRMVNSLISKEMALIERFREIEDKQK